MRTWRNVEAVLAVALVVAGIAVLFWPAALIVAGLFLLADRLT